MPWIRRRADIVVNLDYGDARVVIECQHTKMPIREFIKREQDYGSCAHLLWVFESRMVCPTGPIEVGFERETRGSTAICKAVADLANKQGFVHVMDGDTLQIVSLVRKTRTHWAWDGTLVEREFLRVCALQTLAPPFTVTFRDGQFPRLAEHYE